MPEPLTHVLFFLYVFSAVAIYAGIKSHIQRRAARKHDMKIIMVMAIGGFCAILPDIDALYNYVTMGQLTHGNLMPVTHNLLASYFAFMFATWIGYIVYLNMDKAAYVGVLGSSAYISHLLLDDIVRESGNYYLFPLYNQPISMFTSLGVMRASGDYLLYMLAGIGTTSFILGVMILSIFALDQLGIKIEYRDED